MRRRNGYSIRSLPVLVTVWVALVALIAPVLHLHPVTAAPEGTLFAIRRASSAKRTAVAKPQTTTKAATLTLQNSVAGDDCPLCQWLSSVTYCRTAVTIPLLVLLSSCALLLLAVRLAALCACPAPRRGLRAPPMARLALLA